MVPTDIQLGYCLLVDTFGGSIQADTFVSEKVSITPWYYVPFKVNRVIAAKKCIFNFRYFQLMFKGSAVRLWQICTFVLIVIITA